jgi:hypothetical protein
MKPRIPLHARGTAEFRAERLCPKLRFDREKEDESGGHNRDPS